MCFRPTDPRSSTSPAASGVRFRFDRRPSNGDVHNAFAPGSDLSTPIYTITNGGGADIVNATQRVLGGSWNTAVHPPGSYQVMIWTEDTRSLADTVWIPVTLVEGDPVPPARPVLGAVENDSTDRITVSWYPNTEQDLRGYRLEFTVDGSTWIQRDDESSVDGGPIVDFLRQHPLRNGVLPVDGGGFGLAGQRQPTERRLWFRINTTALTDRSSLTGSTAPREPEAGTRALIPLP